MKTIFFFILLSVLAVGDCLADDDEFSFMDSDFACHKKDKTPGKIKNTLQAMEMLGSMAGTTAKPTWKKTGENTYAITLTAHGSPMKLDFIRDGDHLILNSISPGIGKRKSNPKTFDQVCEGFKNPMAAMQKGMQ